MEVLLLVLLFVAIVGLATLARRLFSAGGPPQNGPRDAGAPYGPYGGEGGTWGHGTFDGHHSPGGHGAGHDGGGGDCGGGDGGGGE